MQKLTPKQLMVKVLTKKAKGYVYKERTDEYNVVDGVPVAIKRKVVTKHAHPDVSAIRALLLLDDQLDVSALSDQQLQEEKLRLLQLLADMDKTSPNAD